MDRVADIYIIKIFTYLYMSIYGYFEHHVSTYLKTEILTRKQTLK